jgi:hypothetical protein
MQHPTRVQLWGSDRRWRGDATGCPGASTDSVGCIDDWVCLHPNKRCNRCPSECGCDAKSGRTPPRLFCGFTLGFDFRKDVVAEVERDLRSWKCSEVCTEHLNFSHVRCTLRTNQDVRIGFPGQLGGQGAIDVIGCAFAPSSTVHDCGAISTPVTMKISVRFQMRYWWIYGMCINGL